MRYLVVAILVGLGSFAAASVARADDRIVLGADRDDDDGDGVPDADEPVVPNGPELVPVRVARSRATPLRVRGDAARVLERGRPLSAGAMVLPSAHLALEGVRGGRAEFIFGEATLRVTVLEVHAFDGDGREVDLARSHASIQRTPPERLGDDPTANTGDPDALRFVIAAFPDDLPTTVSLASYSSQGETIDAEGGVPLTEVPCPTTAAKNLACASTPPIRAVPDDIDRHHPLVAKRSLKAELGGAIAVLSPRGDKLQMIRVAGPRRTAVGSIERLRAHLKMYLVRPTVKGSPPLGGDDAGALVVARAELERTNALWSACGVSFGPARELDAVVVDPPRPHMIAVGCDHGLPASGGVLRARVEGHDVSARVPKGATPAVAARLLASAVRAAGLAAAVSDNVAMGAGAFGTTDVLVRRAGGGLALVEPSPSGPLSTDATLTACIGRVDLDDGLQHFSDIDAMAGTVEERALIKAFDDEPGVVRVFFVPSFASGARIGESFIHADGGAIRNVVIEDRAGIRADRASYALAHELGHVLLDDPGHPDDFGADTPTRLMDADAANPSAYGPRRLTLDECARVVRQAGPTSRVPLLRAWPLMPLHLRSVGNL